MLKYFSCSTGTVCRYIAHTVLYSKTSCELWGEKSSLLMSYEMLASRDAMWRRDLRRLPLYCSVQYSTIVNEVLCGGLKFVNSGGRDERSARVLRRRSRPLFFALNRISRIYSYYCIFCTVVYCTVRTSILNTDAHTVFVEYIMQCWTVQYNVQHIVHVVTVLYCPV